jgi:hypothetical protein
VVMLPLAVHLPVAGLSSSALARNSPEELIPPAARTSPFWSSVAVNPIRGVVMLPVVLHVPVAGL